MPQPSRVALTDVVRTIEIPPAVSAAILAQISVRLDRWISARRPVQVIVPRMEDVALERGGGVWWRRGRSVPAPDAVGALGCLLEALLARAPQRQAPPGLVYVVSRATDPGHLAPIGSVREFAAAVTRHAPARPLGAIDALIARHLADACGAASLGRDSTIADVRRRRRAGGTPLRTIAEDTHIPVSLLRELEWGVYDNWTLPHAASSVAAYAERAGLDPGNVLAVIGRDQQQPETLLPVRVGPTSLAARADRVELRHHALPFALAALLVGVLAVAAPSDHAAPTATVNAETIVRPAAEPPHIPNTPARREGETRVVPVASSAAEDAPPRRQRRQPTNAPRAPHAAPARPTDATRTTEPAAPRHPLIRLAQAIAGDGRYRVEPFPRPAQEDPPH